MSMWSRAPGMKFYWQHPLTAARDLCHGFAIGAVLWPLAIGNAVLARVPAFVSINTSIASPLIYLMFGSLPLVSVQSGSTASLCLGELIASELPVDGTGSELDGERANMASLMAALVGAMHFGMGALDLGAVVELFSQPLLRARAGASALVVILAQAKTIFATPAGNAMSPLLSFVQTCTMVPQRGDLPTCLLSCSLLAALIILKVIATCDSKKPQDLEVKHERCRCLLQVLRVIGRVLNSSANFLVLVAGAVASDYLGKIETLDRFQPPSPRLPQWDLHRLPSVLPTAALTAFLSLGSHLTVAERIRRPQDYWSSRRELLAVGGCGLTAATVGGMPVMANFAVCQALSGCSGHLAVLGNALGHLAAFYLVAELPGLRIPRCAVSVILVVEFAPLLRTLPSEIAHLYRQARVSQSGLRVLVASDLGIYLMSFLAPLLFGVVNGSLLAVVIQVLVSVSRFAGAGYVQIGRVPGTDTYDELSPGSMAVDLPKIIITRPLGPRWFGNAAANTRAARRERRNLSREILIAIVDWRMVPFLDETALLHYTTEWSKLDVKVLVTNACLSVRRQIQGSGLADVLQQSEDTLSDLHAAVLWAEEHIRQIESSRTTFGVVAKD